jgi:hypothetical protein
LSRILRDRARNTDIILLHARRLPSNFREHRAQHGSWQQTRVGSHRRDADTRMYSLSDPAPLNRPRVHRDRLAAGMSPRRRCSAVGRTDQIRGLHRVEADAAHGTYRLSPPAGMCPTTTFNDGRTRRRDRSRSRKARAMPTLGTARPSQPRLHDSGASFEEPEDIEGPAPAEMVLAEPRLSILGSRAKRPCEDRQGQIDEQRADPGRVVLRLADRRFAPPPRSTFRRLVPNQPTPASIPPTHANGCQSPGRRP